MDRAYTVRLCSAEDSALKLRMRNLGYSRASTFLRDAALGKLARDEGDGLPGWCHDIMVSLNTMLREPEMGSLRPGLLDIARRIERGLKDLQDVTAQREQQK